MASLPILSVAGLLRRFEGLVAVRDYALDVRAGEIVGVIGPNGAGKTTIFNIISGHLPPTTGRILFRDQEITHLPADRIAQLGIARTFQNIRLFPRLSARMNVLVASQLHRRYSAADVLLGLKRFHDDERRLNKATADLLSLLGLVEIADVEVGTLPLGIQRRVEIARALAIQPTLLLLDEPSGGMTAQEAVDLVALLQRLRAELNLTICLIEHDMRVVSDLCERVQVLDFGQVIAEGTPRAIREHPDVIAAYLGVEADAQHPGS